MFTTKLHAMPKYFIFYGWREHIFQDNPFRTPLWHHGKQANSIVVVCICAYIPPKVTGEAFSHLNSEWIFTPLITWHWQKPNSLFTGACCYVPPHIMDTGLLWQQQCLCIVRKIRARKEFCRNETNIIIQYVQTCYLNGNPWKCMSSYLFTWIYSIKCR